MRACQEVQGKERNEREKKPDGPKREGIDKRKRKEERRNVTDIQIQDNVTRESSCTLDGRVRRKSSNETI